MRNHLIWMAAVALPVVLWAYAAGPPTGSAGVPGEGTCAECHAGTAVGNQVGVSTTAATYQPGVPMPISVTITDTFNVYGFQATARFESDAKAQAGFFRATAPNYLIQCASLDLTFGAEKTGTACPSERPLEYIMQSQASSITSFTFEWTPPANATGPIIIYVAANAANGNRQNTGDRIHTGQLRLTPSAAAPGRPSISAGGVVQALQFGGGTRIASGAWVEIYGSNLSGTTRGWAEADFTGMNAPTSLDDVNVTIGGRPAFVAFVSPGQVNVQVPEVGTGQTTVTIRNPGGTSDNFMVSSAGAVNPGWWAPTVFRVNNRQYIGAQHADFASTGQLVGPSGFFPGFNTRSARPGDVIVLYGIGFGAVTPAVPPGRRPTAAAALNAFSLRFGEIPVTVQYAGVTPGQVGLYQVNAVIPATLELGDYEVLGTVNGVNLPAGIFINLR
jgi:uncharacterized protein (TIGR03437 family)